MANWVRFADTKATILTAILGVALTMLMARAGTIEAAIGLNRPGGRIVCALATVALLAFCYTLYWLLRAIAPRRDAAQPTLNRFAWPTLTNRTTDDVLAHTGAADAGRELWQQVIDLSGMAAGKFKACNRAIYGLAVFILTALACVLVAIRLVP